MPRRDDPTRVLASMIQLAQAPDFGDDDDGDEDEDDDNEYMDDDSYGGDEDVDKGKPVSGPRTKLSASVDRLITQSRALKKSNAILARGMAYIIDRLDRAEVDDDDDRDEDRDDEKEDKGRGAPAARSTVNKDDAASSFGEQDANTPGNRPFDPTNTAEDMTVIQGGPSAGPGPTSGSGVSKGLQRTIDDAVAAGIRKALANPTVMTSGVYGGAPAAATAQQAMNSTLDNAGEESLSPFDPRWLNPRDEHGNPIMSDRQWFQRANQLRRATTGLSPINS